MWVIGGTKVPGGYNILRSRGRSWGKMPGQGAVRIDVDSDGNAWVVTDEGGVAKY